MGKASKQNTEIVPSVAEEIRVTPLQLAEMLVQTPDFEVKVGQKLVIHGLHVNDFLAAVAASEWQKKLQVLMDAFKQFYLEVSLEGSISLGEFNLADHAWTLLPGQNGSFTIRARPTSVKKTVNELVSFLNLLPVGQALSLKPKQDLLISGLSSDAMLEFYRFCQENEGGPAREKEQDKLFASACQTLSLKHLSLRIYGVNAVQIDRTIDVASGGILFRVLGNDELKAPSLIITLLPTELPQNS